MNFMVDVLSIARVQWFTRAMREELFLNINCSYSAAHHGWAR